MYVYIYIYIYIHNESRTNQVNYPSARDVRLGFLSPPASRSRKPLPNPPAPVAEPFVCLPAWRKRRNAQTNRMREKMFALLCLA